MENIVNYDNNKKSNPVSTGYLKGLYFVIELLPQILA